MHIKEPTSLLTKSREKSRWSGQTDKLAAIRRWRGLGYTVKDNLSPTWQPRRLPNTNNNNENDNTIIQSYTVIKSKFLIDFVVLIDFISSVFSNYILCNKKLSQKLVSQCLIERLSALAPHIYSSNLLLFSSSHLTKQNWETIIPSSCNS